MGWGGQDTRTLETGPNPLLASPKTCCCGVTHQSCKPCVCYVQFAGRLLLLTTCIIRPAAGYRPCVGRSQAPLQDGSLLQQEWPPRRHCPSQIASAVVHKGGLFSSLPGCPRQPVARPAQSGVPHPCCTACVLGLTPAVWYTMSVCRLDKPEPGIINLQLPAIPALLCCWQAVVLTMHGHVPATVRGLLIPDSYVQLLHP